MCFTNNVVNYFLAVIFIKENTLHFPKTELKGTFFYIAQKQPYYLY